MLLSYQWNQQIKRSIYVEIALYEEDKVNMKNNYFIVNLVVMSSMIEISNFIFGNMRYLLFKIVWSLEEWLRKCY